MDDDRFAARCVDRFDCPEGRDVGVVPQAEAEADSDNRVGISSIGRLTDTGDYYDVKMTMQQHYSLYW